MNYKDIKGKQVIDITDGELIGLVEDLNIDLKSGRVESVAIKKSHGSFVVPFEKIVTWGRDLILVKIGGELIDDKEPTS